MYFLYKLEVRKLNINGPCAINKDFVYIPKINHTFNIYTNLKDY